jgi:chemotaxis protein MotB
MKTGAKTAPVEEKKPRRRVKKVKGHGGHHGGAWKVAYADFVTAMMALFLVLWLVSQADTKLKESIANYFRSPGVFTATKGGVLPRSTKVSKDPSAQDDQELLTNAANVLNRKFERNPQLAGLRDQVKVEVTEEGLRIQILDKAEQVSFSSGSALLTESAAGILDEVAKGICDLPNPIFIGGHTDRRVFPAGSVYTNWELSADRANAARRYLIARCVKPEQVRRVIGYGDTELLVPDDPYAPANRRISITVARLKARGATGVSRLGKPEKAEPDSAEAAQESKPSPPEPHETGGKEHADSSDHPEAKGARSATEAPGKKLSAAETAQRLAETKLRNEGSISVGTPDQLPAGVKRTRTR